MYIFFIFGNNCYIFLCSVRYFNWKIKLRWRSVVFFFLKNYSLEKEYIKLIDRKIKIVYWRRSVS